MSLRKNIFFKKFFTCAILIPLSFSLYPLFFLFLSLSLSFPLLHFCFIPFVAMRLICIPVLVPQPFLMAKVGPSLKRKEKRKKGVLSTCTSPLCRRFYSRYHCGEGLEETELSA